MLSGLVCTICTMWLIKVGRKSSARISTTAVALDCIGLQIHMHMLWADPRQLSLEKKHHTNFIHSVAFPVKHWHFFTNCVCFKILASLSLEIDLDVEVSHPWLGFRVGQVIQFGLQTSFKKEKGYTFIVYPDDIAGCSSCLFSHVTYI